MYRSFCCILPVALSMVALSVSGQVSPDVANLKPALSSALTTAGSADDAVGQSLVSAMLTMASVENRSGRQQMTGLVMALRGAMVGRPVSDAQASALSQCIVDVLRGKGSSNFAVAARVRQQLTALRVGDQKMDLIVRRFVSFAESVHGADDLPVLTD